MSDCVITDFSSSIQQVSMPSSSILLGNLNVDNTENSVTVIQGSFEFISTQDETPEFKLFRIVNNVSTMIYAFRNTVSLGATKSISFSYIDKDTTSAKATYRLNGSVTNGQLSTMGNSIMTAYVARNSTSKEGQ